MSARLVFVLCMQLKSVELYILEQDMKKLEECYSFSRNCFDVGSNVEWTPEIPFKNVSFSTDLIFICDVIKSTRDLF